MNAKGKAALYWMLACLPALLLSLLLTRMPDRIPMHYNFAGQVTRMGSKYELLLIPLIGVAVAAILRLIGVRGRQKGQRGSQNEKVLFTAGLLVSLFFGALALVIASLSGRGQPPVPGTMPFNALSFTVSCLFLLLGNLLPKRRRVDSWWLAVGFRTPWTMRDDTVWNKTNRLGGYLLVCSGLAGIPLSLFVKGYGSLLALVALLVLSAAAGTIYSWRLYSRLHPKA